MSLRPIQFVSLVVPVGLLLTALLNLYAFFHRRSDIWWTPLPKAVPVVATGDRVEIYARGTDLRTLLDAGRVRVTGDPGAGVLAADDVRLDRKSTRLNSSHVEISYAVFCLKK